MKRSSVENNSKKRNLRHRFPLFISICICLTFLMVLVNVTMAIALTQEEMKRSIQIINPRPDFALSLRLDKGTGATYVPGERIRIYFRTSKDAYVTLFGYDTAGNIRLLFPNQQQKDYHVKAKQEYYIDGLIETDTPVGFEYVQGFATTEPVIITRELQRTLEDQYLPKIGEDIKRFNLRIKGILTGLSSQKWASSEILHYRVLERRVEYGQLRINSSPEGASVYLDDRYAGKTPLVMDQIRLGEHKLRIEKPDYDDWTRIIQINPNRPTSIQANLELLQFYGSIAIRSDENNARIYLDNVYKGLTQKDRNVMLEQVTEGYHEIRITLGGYHDWSRRVEVVPNQRIQLSVFLQEVAQTGKIEINADVDNAMIYLDGDYQKRTSSARSVIIDGISEGNHELRIVKEGYQDYNDTIRIYSNHTHQVNIRMQPLYRRGTIALYSNENNAKVFLNGTYITTTLANKTRMIDDLKEGLYEITVTKDGYRTWLEEIWVYSGESTSVFADLVKISNN